MLAPIGIVSTLPRTAGPQLALTTLMPDESFCSQAKTAHSNRLVIAGLNAATGDIGVSASSRLPGLVRAMAFSPMSAQETKIFVAYQTSLKVYSLKNNDLIPEWCKACPGVIRDMATKGKWLLLGGYSGQLHCLDMTLKEDFMCPNKLTSCIYTHTVDEAIASVEWLSTAEHHFSLTTDEGSFQLYDIRKG